MSPAGAGQTVLFVRTDRLGETVLNLPAVHAVRRGLPNARLVFIVQPALRELFAGHPDLDDVIEEPSWHGPWWARAPRIAEWWRTWRATTILVSNPRKDYHLAARLAAIPARVGWNQKWPWLLTHRVPARAALAPRHEVDHLLELPRALGLDIANPRLDLAVSDDEAQTIARRLASRGIAREPVVAIHPWTSNPAKQWALDRFRTLIDRLSRTTACVVVGGPDEAGRARALCSATSGRVADLTGALSTRQLAACLRMSRVLVSNDSGPVHVAAAVGTPVVARSGASAGSRWGPWGTGHTVIQRKSMDAITVEEVVESLQPYLADPTSPRSLAPTAHP